MLYPKTGKLSASYASWTWINDFNSLFEKRKNLKPSRFPKTVRLNYLYHLAMNHPILIPWMKVATA